MSQTPNRILHDQELRMFHPMQQWQSIQRRDIPSSESKTIGTLKNSGTRGDRKVRYGWLLWDKVKKSIGKNIGKEDVSKKQQICWAMLTS